MDLDTFLQNLTTAIKHGSSAELLKLIFVPERIVAECQRMGLGDDYQQMLLMPFEVFYEKDFVVSARQVDTLSEVDRAKFAFKKEQDGIEVECVAYLKYEGKGEKFSASAPVGKVDGAYKLIA
ncbi:hypothetical protein [Pseudanabaena sp. PCC 6802]|uniref:hypothetical protein n=1 Tax=Pseudanabaena sp. PCC 6802 TaxID=118173 RepID=UPI00034656B3|nr:hypothetical protein [Pseudanabaena sp. PCC 6802]